LGVGQSVSVNWLDHEPITYDLVAMGPYSKPIILW